MLKILSFLCAVGFSSAALAASSYRCFAPDIGEEGLSLEWTVEDGNMFPPYIRRGGPAGVIDLYPKNIEGFWFRDDMLLIALRWRNPKSDIVVKAHREGDIYSGELQHFGQTYPVTCAQKN